MEWVELPYPKPWILMQVNIFCMELYGMVEREIKIWYVYMFFYMKCVEV